MSNARSAGSTLLTLAEEPSDRNSNYKMRDRARWLYQRAADHELQVRELTSWLSNNEAKVETLVIERTHDTLRRMRQEISEYRGQADMLMSTITTRMIGLGPVAA